MLHRVLIKILLILLLLVVVVVVVVSYSSPITTQSPLFCLSINMSFSTLTSAFNGWTAK